MRYGVREICNVVLKNSVTKEPVLYLDSLKTSSMEFKGNTVYARGARGNAKLIGWDSEKEVTLKMEDALISKQSLQVLTGSKFESTTRPVHMKEVVQVVDSGSDKIVNLSKEPTAAAGYTVFFYKTDDGSSLLGQLTATVTTATGVTTAKFTGATLPAIGDKVIVDYYVDAPVKAESITITGDQFPGTYLLEAETLWRNEDGEDVPAIITIPKLKVMPNFTISMSSSGDPSVFSFETAVLSDVKNGNSMVVIDVLE